MNANALAHEIHRRNMALDPNAPRHRAAGVAVFCDMYGFTPDHDAFNRYMDLYIHGAGDPEGDSVTLVTGDSENWVVPGRLDADFTMFSVGSTLAETDIVGWLPRERLVAAPSATLGREPARLVNGKCIFPMPVDLDFSSLRVGFAEPEIDVPGVWDYDLQALWTPLGFHVYDYTMARMVAQADSRIK